MTIELPPQPPDGQRPADYPSLQAEGGNLEAVLTERHRQVVCLGVVLPGLVVVAIATRYKGYRYPIEVIGHAV